MIELGEIEDRKEGNSFHKLYLCDRNAYYRFNQTLDSIWWLVNSLDQPILNQSEIEDSAFRKFDESFQATCITIIDNMFMLLLAHANNERLSKNDSEILSTKILSMALQVKNRYLDERAILSNIEDLAEKGSKKFKEKLSKNPEKFSKIELELERKKNAAQQRIMANIISCLGSLKTNLQ